MSSKIAKIYGNQVRLRVCGICWQGSQILLVKHNMDGQPFWAPPGGGIAFEEPMEKALIREFKEETNLTIRVDSFSFGCEFIHPPLHAIELFYTVTSMKGAIHVGQDPELSIIEDVRYIPLSDVLKFPIKERHGIFNLVKDISDFQLLQGFYKI
jgi:8-oxo-dGTP diphosphatase